MTAPGDLCYARPITMRDSLHIRLHNSTPAGEYLPDAVTVRTGACFFHRAGQTGRGVRVALVDTGVRAGAWFGDRGFRLHGDTSDRDAHHGTAMAALLFSIAPDIDVYSFRVGDDPARALVRACEASQDLIVAAWGVNEGKAPLVDASRCIAVRDPDRMQQWPASIEGCHSVDGNSRWSKGPFSCGAIREPFGGISASVAITTGMAALLVGMGVPVTEAIPFAITADPETMRSSFLRDGSSHLL